MLNELSHSSDGKWGREIRAAKQREIGATPSPSVARGKSPPLMNGTELECDGEELRPDGMCAKCERINERIAAKVATAPPIDQQSALDEIEVALISIADGVSPHDAMEAAFRVINRERTKTMEAMHCSPVPVAEGDEDGEQFELADTVDGECFLCRQGFPIKDGVHYGTQSLGMIPSKRCATDSVGEEGK